MSTIVALLLVYPLWVLVHEGTHALVAKRFGATVESFKPYPNTSTGRFTWGSVRWRGTLSDHENAIVSFSPRVPAFVATLLLPLAAYGPDFAIVLVAGGLVDQVVNFIGMSERSDLSKWSDGWGHNPWHWRCAGQTIAIVSAALTLVIRFG
jgi:hypothetical protein